MPASNLRGTAVTVRSAVTVADKLVVPTIATLVDQTGQAGSLTAASHGAAVAPGNLYGTAGTTNILTATPTVSKSLDLTVPQVTGATYYDIFCSLATTGPLWVGRVTEAQRAAGCQITAVGTVNSTPGPGGAGIVNIQVVGTGIANTHAIFAYNNAYSLTNVTQTLYCSGFLSLMIKVNLTLTDLRAAPTINIIPFFSSDGSTWYAGSSYALNPLSTMGYPLYQELRVDVKGEKYVKILVGSISGTGASANIYCEVVP